MAKMLIDGEDMVIELPDGSLRYVNLKTAEVSATVVQGPMPSIAGVKKAFLPSHFGSEMGSKQAAEYLGIERWFVSELDRMGYLKCLTPEKAKGRMYSVLDLDYTRNKHDDLILSHRNRIRRERKKLITKE
jgi:hypothetical protein